MGGPRPVFFLPIQGPLSFLSGQRTIFFWLSSPKTRFNKKRSKDRIKKEKTVQRPDFLNPVQGPVFVELQSKDPFFIWSKDRTLQTKSAPWSRCFQKSGPWTRLFGKSCPWTGLKKKKNGPWTSLFSPGPWT